MAVFRCVKFFLDHLLLLISWLVRLMLRVESTRDLGRPSTFMVSTDSKLLQSSLHLVLLIALLLLSVHLSDPLLSCIVSRAAQITDTRDLADLMRDWGGGYALIDAFSGRVLIHIDLIVATRLSVFKAESPMLLLLS